MVIVKTTPYQDRYTFTRVINARGPCTPLGVSRSGRQVGRAVAHALGRFFVMDELQTVASEAVSRLTGAAAAAVTHCVSAGITLSVAAAMAGDAPERVAALPDTTGMPHRVVLPAGHAVNYGHPLVQDLRLAGALPVLAGTDKSCPLADLERALAHGHTACLLLVSSRLVRGDGPNLAEAVAAAHCRGVPAIIDGAAQDMRIDQLLATGADLVLVSAHKYLASPTAGLAIGRQDLVNAVRAHEAGIGRAMKATKEAIVGVLAALEDRESLDLDAWRCRQEKKVSAFVRQAQLLVGVHAAAVPDPAGMPFSRVHLTIDAARAGIDATALARTLRTGTDPIWVMEHNLEAGQLILELVPLTDPEIGDIQARLAAALAPVRSRQGAEPCRPKNRSKTKTAIGSSPNRGRACRSPFHCKPP
jgi:uncharacterized pyridoxal phosphate-dependent enzyme